MSQLINTTLTDAERITDIVVLVTCALLVLWFLVLRVATVFGRAAKQEDAWMDEHLRETTATTGRENGR